MGDIPSGEASEGATWQGGLERDSLSMAQLVWRAELCEWSGVVSYTKIKGK